MSDLIKIADWAGKPRANVIFVHGLGGHAYDTWRCTPEEKSYWPLWLAEDVEGIAVYTLGYAAPPSNWLGTSMPLQDRVSNVRTRLLAALGHEDVPITFVCHSLGGLIVKQLLLDLHQQKDRAPEAAALLNRVTQVVFMATPHTGSRKGTLLDRLSFVAWPTSIARVLVANDPTLRNINVSYRGLADERRKVLQHRVFYETQSTVAGGIVDEASADPGLPGEPPIPIDADHINIVKPLNRTALQYVVTRDFVAKNPQQEGQVWSFKSYPLPQINYEQPKNIAPKAVRIALLVLVGFVVYKGGEAINRPTQISVHATGGGVAVGRSVWWSSIWTTLTGGAANSQDDKSNSGVSASGGGVAVGGNVSGSKITTDGATNPKTPKTQTK